MNAFYLNLEDKYFNRIKNNQKTIEMRLYSPKRREIQIGDYIVFTNNLDKETLKVKVTNIHVFKDFKEMYKSIDKEKLGYLPLEEAKPTDMNKFYKDEEITLYGVVGFEISLCD